MNVTKGIQHLQVSLEEGLQALLLFLLHEEGLLGALPHAQGAVCASCRYHVPAPAHCQAPHLPQNTHITSLIGMKHLLTAWHADRASQQE